MVIGVTGATGHIGHLLCQDLVKKGFTVIAFLRNHTVHFQNENIKTVFGDITDRTALSGFISQCDIIIHTAAQISLGYGFDQVIYDTNVRGTELVLELAKDLNIKKVITFSSVHAFSHFPYDAPLDENRQLVGDDAIFYDQTKRDALRMSLDAASDGLNISVLCPTGVVGPPDHRPSKMGKAIIDIYRGSVPAVIRGGFDFVDVRDIVTATISAIDHARPGQAYLLGGEYVSLKRLSGMILHEKGSRKRLVELPLFIAYLGLPIVKLYAKHMRVQPLYDKPYLDILRSGNSQIDCTKAQQDLGFKSRPFYETVHDTIGWMRTNGKI